MANPLFPIQAYTIGWICALSSELSAARKMLEYEHRKPKSAPRDENNYCFGSINGHNIVIACLPNQEIGCASTASLARDLVRTFDHIRYGLLVGIGGAVPGKNYDVRLGDVVINQPNRNQLHGGVVQFDFGKDTPEGFQRTGHLNKTAPRLQATVMEMKSNDELEQNDFLHHLKAFDSLDAFRRPESGTDRLFMPKCKTHHFESPHCDLCGQYEYVNRIERVEGKKTVVHYGTIASGDKVMRSSKERDAISESLGGVLCFEMEAAGLMNNFPCLVVRGMADYADEHKTKLWQKYAAAVAAACAREILFILSPTTVMMTKFRAKEMIQDSSLVDLRSVRVSPKRSRHSCYLERPEFTRDMEQKCLPDPQNPQKEPVQYPLHGMGGSGKSQICIDFYVNHHKKYTHSIWIDASTAKNLEQGFYEAGKQAQLNEGKMTSADVVSWLSRLSEPWLLVLDDISNDDYTKYIPTIGPGTILLTSRKNVKVQLSQEIGPLEPKKAFELLRAMLSNYNDFKEPEEVTSAEILLQRLSFLPLAISLAATCITTMNMSFRKYLDVWQRVFEVNHDTDPEQRTLSATIQASYEEFRKKKSPKVKFADELLHLFAFLDSKRASETILHRTWLSLSVARKDHGIHPQVIQRLVLRVIASNHPEVQWCEIEADIREALALLAQFSFLSFDGDRHKPATMDDIEHRNWIHMHDLVRTWVRRYVKSQSRKHYQGWLEITAFTLATSIRTETPRSYRRLVIPHIDSLLKVLSHEECLSIIIPGSIEPCEAAFRFSDAYSVCGYFREAKEIRKSIYKKLSGVQGDQPSPTLITSALLLAESYTDLGRYQKAFDLRRHAYTLGLKRNSVVNNHEEMIRCMRDLAHSYSDLKDHDAANELRTRILERLSTYAYGTDMDPGRDIFRAMTSKASSLGFLGEYDEAKSMLKKSIAGLIRSEGDTDHDVLIARAELANIYSKVGRAKDALEEREAILARRRQIHKNHVHHDVLIAMEDVASSQCNTGNMMEAFELRKEAVHGFGALGSRISNEHPSFSSAKLNLARSYYDIAKERFSNDKLSLAQDCIDEAVRLHEEVLDARTSSAEFDHCTIITSTDELATCLSLQARIMVSISVDRNIGKRVLKQRHWINKHERATENHTRALNLKNTIIEILLSSKSLSTDNQQRRLLGARNALAMCYLDFGRIEEAWAINEEIRNQKVTSEHAESFNVIILRDGGRIQLERRKIREAAALFEEAYNVSVIELGKYNPTTLDILESLAKAVRKTNVSASANWFHQLLREQNEVMGPGSARARHTAERLEGIYKLNREDPKDQERAKSDLEALYQNYSFYFQ